jgi:hypothetical protein
VGIFDGIEDDIRKGPVCRMSIIIGKLDKPDRDALADVLLNDLIPSTVIARRLSKAGHPIPGESLQRHRRGVCACKS